MVDRPSPRDNVHGQIQRVSCAGQEVPSAALSSLQSWLMSQVALASHIGLVGSVGQLRQTPSLFSRTVSN